MNYPIVQVTSRHNHFLHGLFIEAENPKAVFLFVHGTASNFYEEDFIEVMTKAFLPKGISMLSTNNRGAGVYDAYTGFGAATEMFEDCVEDIDAWIAFAVQRGYSNVILAGHSLGTEKVVYYMNHGKHTKHVTSVVLLAPADSNWYQRADKGQVVDSAWNERTDRIVDQAEKMIAAGKGDAFLPRDAYAGIMPKTAASMINFLGQGQAIRHGLPFHVKTLSDYAKIRVPILVVIGDQHEYTVLPISEALALMVKENPRTETHVLKNSDHDFTGREDELTALVLEFMTRGQGGTPGNLSQRPKGVKMKNPSS